MSGALALALRTLVVELVRDELARQQASFAADRLLSIEEAATVLGVRQTPLYAELQSGRLRSVHSGRRRLVPACAISQWVEAREVSPDEQAHHDRGGVHKRRDPPAR